MVTQEICLTPPVQGETECGSFLIGETATLKIPKFNPAENDHGVLIGVQADISFKGLFDVCVKNIGSMPCTGFRFGYVGAETITTLTNNVPDLEDFDLILFNGTLMGVGTLDVTDGIPDCGVGAWVRHYEEENLQSIQVSAQDPLGPWTGTGSVKYSIATQGLFNIDNQCPNISFIGTSRLQVTTTVTYTYEVNQGPCCADICDKQYVDEDEALGIPINVLNLSCVTDYEDDALDPTSLIIVDPMPLHGTAVANQAGIIHYTPTQQDYCGDDTVWFLIADEWGNYSEYPCEIPINIEAVNDKPIARGDKTFDPGNEAMCLVPYNRLNDGSPIILDICLNDSDPDGLNGCGLLLNCNTIEITQNSITCDPPVPASDITVVRVGDHVEVTFADPFYCGTCTFVYRVSDKPDPPQDPTGWLWSNFAQVCLEVVTANNPPVCGDDDYPCSGPNPIMEDGGTYHLDVAANDSDPDSKPCGNELNPWSIVILTPPQHGTAVPSTTIPGTVDYTPYPNYCGPDFFTYRIWDTADQDEYGNMFSCMATVTLEVCPVNDPPTAVDDVAKTFMDVPIVIDVCANDYDIDEEYNPYCGDPLDCTSVIVVAQPTCQGFPGGAIADDTAMDGTILFTPPPGFIGQCTFTYKVFDTNPVSSNVATVTVTINDPDCPTPNRRTPGSLLLFPEFDNQEGFSTILTVTNSSQTQHVDVLFTYRDEQDCAPFSRTEELTPNDTLTLLTSFHNPEQVRGYAYVTALCPQGGDPIAFNHLTGNLIVLDGFEGVAYSVNAVSFEGFGDASAGPACDGALLTDLDGDGLRDLDGMEYEQAPDEILIPRFLGQGEVISSNLILIDLSGGGDFNTTVDFLIYNDNEEEFSSQFTFKCWDKPKLLDITSLFSRDYLVNSTNHDLEEVLGAPGMESGWFRLDGRVGVSSNGSEIEDPAIYAVLIEGNNPERRVADLPFELCLQDNGALLPNSPSGDQD